MAKKRNIALGFYQDPTTAKVVVEELKKKHFFRIATIQKKHDQSFSIQRYFPFLISEEVIRLYKKRVIVDEILVLVEVSQRDVREVLSILRNVKTGHPVTFLLRPPNLSEKNIELPSVPLTMEELEGQARKLAQSLGPVNLDKNDQLMQHFHKTSDMLQFLAKDVRDAEYIEQTISSSAEWLLDNMYVLENSIDDIRRNLPKKYFKVLPKLQNGFPRIDALATRLLKDTACRLSPENIFLFLKAYQEVQPLTIGELWAFPMMLRLRLIEWVELLAIRVDNRMREGELANFWGNRLLYASRFEPDKLKAFFEEMSSMKDSFSPHFAEELIDHLYDEETVLTLLKTQLEKRFTSPLNEVLHQEHLNETSEQVLFSDCIKSLIMLSQLSWQDIFESVSPVDAVLAGDPLYLQMDFTTRNFYRTRIEKISRNTLRSEVEIANIALELSKSGSKPFEQHVGYYLIDEGIVNLEEKTGYIVSFYSSLTRFIMRYAAGCYVGGILLMTLLLLSLLAKYLSFPLLMLALIPISEVSVQFTNLLLATLLPNLIRPKMSYKKGIPEEYKTLIVVPMLLQSQEVIKEALDELEIRYLANTDKGLYFALFSDFVDAASQHAEEDIPLLEFAKEGLKRLQELYGEKFFLFHRQRVFSPCENVWMGEERKRGKLEVLNRFLKGEKNLENMVYFGNPDALSQICYVITLDGDTELTKDQARSLIEIISHPLNRPYLLQNKIERGYTIIQPRVGTGFLQARATLFSRIFSEQTVVDPYTQAVSNIYQDLSQEGSYHGKGIYDLDAFHTLLCNRFPKEHLLSHDLIEGAYVRVGFASNICLFDSFPKDYMTYVKRIHRWIRGDWQIIDWLKGYVPTLSGKGKNYLSALNRWKIFDNLRRSLLPLSLLLFLVFGWQSAASSLTTSLALVVLMIPLMGVIYNKWEEIKILIVRTVISTAFLPIEAYVSLDAIIRVAYRRLISKRNLLQWNTEQTSPLYFIGSSFFGLGVLVLSQDKTLALPFCLLWILAPLIERLLDRPLEQPEIKELTHQDKEFLRDVAKRTWKYYDEWVGPSTHFLPPDNYQMLLNVEVANRTSPTNIGMWLIAALNAYDFEFITCDELIDRTSLTIQELKKLERFQGNFYNWYNIQTLDPLFPRYVSTVDSGNLLSCFWTLKQGLEEVLEAPISLKGSRYHEWRIFLDGEAKEWKPSLMTLAGNAPTPLDPYLKDSPKLAEALSKSRWFAGEKVALVKQMIFEMERFSEEMDLKFLYNPDRKLFAVGYNVDDKRLDSSYYDMLASESRITSLIAIAKGDAPLDHWWALGRLYNVVEGRKVLLSWGGSLFEYLMPLIFNKQTSDSLIGEACNAAVACQINYGKKRGIPWGISESAYTAIDAFKIYQYKSFGIPGLGIKRGLEEDLVVSPYSSILALPINPKAVLENLSKLDKLNLFGPYGFYESMDFTRQRNPKGERGVPVHTYMAHHQGMIFASINNLLNNDVVIKRFSKDPRISGVESLLFERIPTAPPIKLKRGRKEPTLRRLEPFSESPIMGVVDTAKSPSPKINLLSNGRYSLMITNSGGGVSKFEEMDIYRWRADTTKDSFGSFCYVRDKDLKKVWSTTYHPTETSGHIYSVNFKADKAEFRRRDEEIETFLEVVVSPEDQAEIRLLTVTNHSTTKRNLEFTSYLELVLAPHLSDRAHPAYNKLFIETEKVPEKSALLAFRRVQNKFALHVVTGEENVQFETDRGKFIGRGKTLRNPQAVETPLSNTVGTTLDPIFSLRKQVSIEPGGRIQFSFITAVAENRNEAETLIEKYLDITASHRAIELAWTYAQLELRHLRIQQEEMQLFQKLASRIIYPHAQLRAGESRIKKNRLGQSGLWSQGISGDLPLVVVTVGDVYDIDLVKQLLIAHGFFALRGLHVDLVILNEEGIGYIQPLHEQLQNLVQAHTYRNPQDKKGNIFLKNIHHMSEEELNLIFTSARAVLLASRGSLRQQLVSPKTLTVTVPKRVMGKKIPEASSGPLPFLELPYFNGLGGYSKEGGSYSIYLGPGTETPAPWINVIANAEFGTLISESGIGCTWFGNSQTNRLTPWSNDPILDPIVDTIYLRDEDLGTVWTVTPSPIRELDAYRTTHSQGYTVFEHNSHGIDQELTVFVPLNLPVRIQKVKLRNTGLKKRTLTLTAYTEWVLGNDREETGMYIITEWDPLSQSVFAYNYYNPNYGSRVAFSSCNSPLTSYTGDRIEFIGRNKSTKNPEGLQRKSLSNKTGAALDPCAALQTSIDIEPGKEAEVVFILGFAEDEPKARQMIEQCCKSYETLFQETKEGWNHLLETIQVDVPDLATNYLMNKWLIYQTLSCRFWGRSGFYQSSGAYGFRDQLQDVMALFYSTPERAREYILKCASRQYLEGDVQHWWHPETGAGIRTRCSDDLLWLIYVTAQYVRITGDRSILDENVTFLEGELLSEHQEEVFQIPNIAKESGSLLEHCKRALKKGTTSGVHGLPLIGSCDWNDGMSRVGVKGKGESVWLGWFLIQVMLDYAELINDKDSYKEEVLSLAKIIEENAWDGAWYRRAYYDDGTPIGSHLNVEAYIDSISQSWAIISGLGDKERCKIALRSADEQLVKVKEHLVLLLTPPFDKTPEDPGYIKAYPPGVRENGGQYTHGSSWLAMAFARSGEGNKAAELLRMLTPTLHTTTPEANALYRLEPYVIAADVYSLKNQEGRGGWSWYTGSSGWIYRIWLEEVLGFTLRGQTLTLHPVIPTEWEQYKIHYRYKTARYSITVKNHTGKSEMLVDGVLASEIQLKDDGKEHVVELYLE